MSPTFADYLRGFETQSGDAGSPRQFRGSQTTYEDLKPNHAFLLSLISAPSSQTTYEDLKLPDQMANKPEPPCSQTTYEDLKHTGGIIAEIAALRFADYLRGFETLRTGSSPTPASTVRRLPTRI